MNSERIRLRMRELGLSISKLAEKSDLSESTVKRALSGAKMNATTAGLLAQALDVEVNWLIEPTEPGSEPTEPLFEPTEPTAKPTEPEDEEAMIEALNRVIENYKERIEDLKKDKRILAVSVAALVIFIIAFFSYDILNPSVGWFQY